MSFNDILAELKKIGYSEQYGRDIIYKYINFCGQIGAKFTDIDNATAFIKIASNGNRAIVGRTKNDDELEL